ncbi:TonB family protein [Hyphomicrobium sp. xq]|uniref:TonB family protein n=1 Tax=Hyphomicrobium album TaxID=2665159 RepID=A0A6I3KIX1_9HYPH|nr:energy transducer TonB [Hyphomicrobium album]MTD92731.1 TonB family protein [Hyphomicrobium album]
MAFERLPNDQEQTSVGASGEVVRLLVASALAVILLAGGVYWLHQFPAQPGMLQSGAMVEVQLVSVAELQPTDTASVEGVDVEGISTKSGPSSQQDASIAEEAEQPLQSPHLDPIAKADIDYAPALARSPPTETALKFRQILLRHIAQYQRYPAVARMQRLEGTVQVLFRLRRDGSILDAWVSSSSGTPILDTEAISTLYRAEPLPAIPGEMPGELKIVLPIAFSLR